MRNSIVRFLKEQITIGGKPNLEESEIGSRTYEQIDAWEMLRIRICVYRIIVIAVVIIGGIWGIEKFTNLELGILNEQSLPLLESLLLFGLGTVLGKGFFGGKNNDS